MNVAVVNDWVLLLLPVVLLPLIFDGRVSVSYSSVALIPHDRLSNVLTVALRIVAALVIALLLLGLSELYQPEHTIERVGEGAEIVLLLDRSRSMDQRFAGSTYADQSGKSKGAVASDLLAEFAASRPNDLLGMAVFSGRPIAVLPFTEKQDVIQAAIEAGNIGRGLATTDIGAGLVKSLEFFSNRRYTGSRIVVLISDGGAKLGLETRTQIGNLLRRHRVTVYWIYLRSRYSPGITERADETTEAAAPARALHLFLSSLDTPYRVYDAENPQALRDAIEDVNQLQKLPIRYQELLPRRDFSTLCYILALLLITILISVKLVEVKVWR